jgi:hypothetical protein
VIGVAAMVVDQLFARESLARWIEFGTPAGRPEIAEEDDVTLERQQLATVS